MLGLLIFGGIIALLAVYVIAQYNGFIKLRIKTEEAFSTMDVYLKKRYDLIPNLVETVKGYAKHEEGTLTAVIDARNAAATATTPDARIAAEGDLSQVMGRLFALTESYPDLKANTNFMDLQGQLQTLEGEIANSRKYYNGVVGIYNTKREQFPSNIIANMFNFAAKPMFEIENVEERENVKVQF